MGRPIIEIDKEQFEKLCFIHATLFEIAGWFKCSPDTIERWSKKQYNLTFAESFQRFSSGGKMSIRRKLFELANNGNLGALIWLSKQHLGMTDKFEEKREITSGEEKKEVVYVAQWASVPSNSSTTGPTETERKTEVGVQTSGGEEMESKKSDTIADK